MKKRIYSSALAQSAFYRAAAFLSRGTNGYLHFHSAEPRGSDEAPDGWFESEGRAPLPIYSDYRYGIKPCWRNFPGLNALHELSELGLLSKAQLRFLDAARGTRTLMADLNEINAQASEAVRRHAQLFFESTLHPVFRPVRIPSAREISSAVQYWRKSHRIALRKLRSFGVIIAPSTHKSLLEIGYISGGWSAFAFRELGYDTTAIDYFYGDLNTEAPLPEFLAAKLDSDVRFVRGDITKPTDFPEGKFDIVVSSSVLEHIQNLPAAFDEMYRILRTGGLMIHQYNPFFCPNGGHALGTLDCPWGHVRLSKKEVCRYILQERSYEVEPALQWIEHDLNRVRISEMQAMLVEAGFEIAFWQQHAAPNTQLAQLARRVINECFATYPGLSMDDLVTANVSFAAVKS
jgi:SAM-dependent methyltransferase